MKKDELMKVKGIDVPDFKEPKGQEFERVMREINTKVINQRQKKDKSSGAIEKYNKELKEIAFKFLAAEEESEIQALKKRKNEIKDQLENIQDMSDFDIERYKKELFTKYNVPKLMEEATKENGESRARIKKYQNEITKQYERSMALTQKIVADYGAETSYNEGMRIYSRIQ